MVDSKQDYVKGLYQNQQELELEYNKKSVKIRSLQKRVEFIEELLITIKKEYTRI